MKNVKVPKDLLKELSDTYADVIELQSALNIPIKKLIEFVKEGRVKIIGYVDREEEQWQ